LSSGTIRKFPRLTVELPGREIFLRLGGNLYKTRLSAAAAESTAASVNNAFALCQLQGRYTVIGGTRWFDDGIETLSGEKWLLGKDFCARCRQCPRLWMGAVTAGKAVTDARDSRPAVAEQLIYDAVGSESADAAMEQLHRFAATELRRLGMMLAPRRCSPGYNDMPLAIQQRFFEVLDMAEMDVTLSENYFMTPEKSVTAFAAVSTSEYKDN
jgi:hypothetical protein